MDYQPLNINTESSKKSSHKTLKIILIMYKKGNVPANTIAICPKIMKPSSNGAMPGIITIPVKYCREDSASPKVETNINNHPIKFMTKIADF